MRSSEFLTIIIRCAKSWNFRAGHRSDSVRKYHPGHSELQREHFRLLGRIHFVLERFDFEPWLEGDSNRRNGGSDFQRSRIDTGMGSALSPIFRDRRCPSAESDGQTATAAQFDACQRRSNRHACSGMTKTMDTIL